MQKIGLALEGGGLKGSYQIGSYYAFLNNLLRQVAFRENKEDEIIDKLDNIEDKTNAIYEKVNKYGS